MIDRCVMKNQPLRGHVHFGASLLRTEVKRCKAKWCSLWCPPFCWSCFRRLGAEAPDSWFVTYIYIYCVTYICCIYFMMFSICIHMCSHFFNDSSSTSRKFRFIPVSVEKNGWCPTPGFSNPTAGHSPGPWSWRRVAWEKGMMTAYTWHRTHDVLPWWWWWWWWWWWCFRKRGQIDWSWSSHGSILRNGLGAFWSISAIGHFEAGLSFRGFCEPVLFKCYMNILVTYL